MEFIENSYYIRRTGHEKNSFIERGRDLWKKELIITE
jgi:hypothetical protein